MHAARRHRNSDHSAPKAPLVDAPDRSAAACLVGSMPSAGYFGQLMLGPNPLPG
jgi:hypothetical protein